MAPPRVHEWTAVDVQAWLLQQGVSVATAEVTDAFKSNDIDGSTLLELTASDIREELKIASLGVRKKLWAAVETLQHQEENKQLQISTITQRKTISDDIQSVSTASSDYMAAVQLWDSELQGLESTLKDAEFSAQVHCIELGSQRGIDANVAAAEELSLAIETAVNHERIDACIARDIDGKRDERVVQQILSRAQEAAAFPGQKGNTHQTALVKPQIASVSNSRPSGSAAASSSSSQHVFFSEQTLQPVHASSEAHAGTAADSSRGSEKQAANFTIEDQTGNSSGELGVLRQRVECVACREKSYQTEKFPCGHIMCHTCIGKLFMCAANDLTLWPVRCCKQRVDISLAAKVLSPANMKLFTDRVEEAQAVNKMYCTNPYCSQFINIDSTPPGTSQYSCPKCDTELCLVCRTAWHPNISCEQWRLQQKDVALSSELVELAKRKGWRSCGRCGVMVQLAHGCNHMTCRCSHQFCYVCGLPWLKDNGKDRSCKCDLWSERNLVVEENRRVEIVQRVERRIVAPAERVAIRAQIQEEDEECAHDGYFDETPFRYNSINQECQNCGFFMAHYGFRCSECGDLVCFTCRHHRL